MGCGLGGGGVWREEENARQRVLGQDHAQEAVRQGGEGKGEGLDYTKTSNVK